MNDADLIPLLLLVLFSISLTVGIGMVLVLIRRPPRPAERRRTRVMSPERLPRALSFTARPASWLAVKSKNLNRVISALQLHNARPCPLVEGLAGDVKLFVAPPVRGWVLVLGAGLPDPAEDVDACFRFLAALSRKLGEVQFFSANPVVQHHSWIRMVRGKVERAFSWAGKTLWHQGKLTAAEREAGVTCPDYGETQEPSFDSAQSFSAINVEKVTFIAERWSVDPGSLEAAAMGAQHGVAGEWR